MYHNEKLLRLAGFLMLVGTILVLTGCHPKDIKVGDNGTTYDERVHTAWELCTGFSKFETEYEPENVSQEVRIACTQAIFSGR